MKIGDLKDRLWDWINASTGLDASWSYQPAQDGTASAPRPAGYPFATLELLSRRRVGEREIIGPPPNGESELFKVRRQVEFTVSLSIYGDDAGDYIDKAIRYLDSQGVNGDLSRAQVDRVRVDVVVDDSDYSLTINGEPVLVHSGTPASADDIRDAFVTAINLTFPNVTSNAAGDPGEFDVTSKLPGIEFTLGLETRLILVEHTNAVSLVYLRTDAETDLSALVDTTWENRAVSDIIFGTESVFDDEPGVIESVEITDGITDETFNINLGD